MVVKVDKSEEFVKSGKVLISEYPAKKEKDVMDLLGWISWKLILSLRSAGTHYLR